MSENGKERKGLLDNLEEYLLVFLIVVITGLVLVSFVVQFVNKDLVAGINQLSFYAYTWLVFLGVAVAVKHNSHMRIDILFAAYPAGVKKVIGAVNEVLMALFSIVLAVLSVQRVIQVMASGETNAVIGVPVAIIYMAPAVGFVLSVLRYFERLLRSRRKEGEGA